MMQLKNLQVFDIRIVFMNICVCFRFSTDMTVIGHARSLQGKHLVIGNVGDSRAILGTRAENGSWKAVQLTVDLKPNLPRTVQVLHFMHSFHLFY